MVGHSVLIKSVSESTENINFILLTKDPNRDLVECEMFSFVIPSNMAIISSPTTRIIPLL